MPLGLYISVPFCRSKCSYCNFASDVFSSAIFRRYIDRLCADIARSAEIAEQIDAVFERAANSVYLGGGTPTVLDIAELQRLFVTISQNFDVQPGSEITVECAPGTLTPALLDLDEDARLGRELIAGGTRYHAHFVPDDDVTAHLYEIACERLDNAGIRQYEISNFARQGHESRHNLKYWTRQPYLGFGVDAHSMLQAKAGMKAVDQKGRSLTGCEQTPVHGIGCEQTSVPSMAEKGASSLVPRSPFPWSFREGFSPRGICFSDFPCGPLEAVRFAMPDSLDKFLAGAPPLRTPVSAANSEEERFFLGLRLNRGVDLSRQAASFVEEAVKAFASAIAQCIEQDLVERDHEKIRLTSRGRLLSNEVFARFLAPTECIG